MTFRLSRRQMLVGGAAALASASLASHSAASPSATAAAPILQAPPQRGLTAVTAQLSGVGVYIGNEWQDFSDAGRRFALARVRSWGFDFVCPKVGGYARSTYRDADDLRRWAAEARGVGLGFIPFLYTVPETSADDALMAAEMAQTAGIVCVDMEDEWGAKEKGAPGYKGAQMAQFGRIYRQEAGNLPVIVTGYGDPITRFGAGDAAFPYEELAGWADAYSPQWYIGVYARYKKGGVAAAMDWVEAEVRQTLGAGFGICPSVAVESLYSADKLLPLPDTLQLMERCRAYSAPIFVWHYMTMTAGAAEALLGPPRIENVRIGRISRTAVSVAWDTTVPARSSLTVLPSAPGKVAAAVNSSLELTSAASLAELASGAAYPVVLRASTAAGLSQAVPMTLATAPPTPGVFVQSAIASRAANGRILVTLLVANSGGEDLQDVSVASLSVDHGTVISPADLPASLGPLLHRDWQASNRDRAELSIIVDGADESLAALTVNLNGTTEPGGGAWSSAIPAPLTA